MHSSRHRSRTHTQKSIFDTCWKQLPFGLLYPREEGNIPQPKSLQEILGVAAALGKGLGFLSADFYDIDGHLYFGEKSFVPESGFAKFCPSEIDRVLGDKWDLSKD